MSVNGSPDPVHTLTVESSRSVTRSWLKLYSLWSTEEEVEVPELDPHPLAGFAEEEVGAGDVLGVGPRVGGSHDFTRPFVLSVHCEGTRRMRRWCTYLVVGWKHRPRLVAH